MLNIYALALRKEGERYWELCCYGAGKQELDEVIKIKRLTAKEDKTSACWARRIIFNKETGKMINFESFLLYKERN